MKSLMLIFLPFILLTTFLLISDCPIGLRNKSSLNRPKVQNSAISLQNKNLPTGTKSQKLTSSSKIQNLPISTKTQTFDKLKTRCKNDWHDKIVDDNTRMDVIYCGKNFRLVRDEELPGLLETLSYYLPESLKFHQTLRTFLRDRVWNFYFYVSNNWPQEPICLHFPGITQTMTGDLYESFSVFCPTDRLECARLLREEDILIDWTKTLYINYINASLMEHIEHFYSNIGVITEKVYGDFYIYQGPTKMEEISIQKSEFETDDIKLEQIKKRDAKLIYDLYPVQTLESITIFERLIEKLPSCGVYVHGELAAWALHSYYGAMFSMQTRQDYRRQGFGKRVAKCLTQLVLSRGYIPFVVIIPDNTISRDLYIKLGFKKLYRNVRAILRPFKDRKIKHYSL